MANVVPGRFSAQIEDEFVVPVGRKAQAAAARIGASTIDEPALEPY